MSKLKNTFGFTGSLLDTIKGVYEAAKAPGTEAREKIVNVPRKAGDENLRARQGEIQRKIVDEGLKGGQHKIDVAAPKGKLTKADFDKLRSMKSSMKKEEVEEEIDESLMKSVKRGLTLWGGSKHLKDIQHHVKNASDDQLIRLSRGKNERPDPHTPRDLQTKLINRELKRRYGVKPGLKNEEVELDEADKTYPYKASQLTPIMVQLRSLIKFLSRSGVLKSLMREDYALYQVYMGEQFDADQLQSLLEEIEDLLEGRPKGSKNKSKMASAAPAPAKKSSDDDEEEEEEAPAYKPASGKDVEHVMPQLAGAADVGGRHITTAKGPKYVSGSTATKIHKHLMGLKAPDRAEASSKIYHMDDSHPAVKAIHADHEAAVKRGVKTPGEKRGRGRPKKNA